MYKIKVLIIGILCVVAMASCKNKKVEAPEDVTKAFVVAFYTADYDQMYKLTPQNNRVILQELQKQMNIRKDRLESMHKNHVEIYDTKCTMISDSTAECACDFSVNKQSRHVVYDLCKENDCWLVNLRVN